MKGLRTLICSVWRQLEALEEGGGTRTCHFSFPSRLYSFAAPDTASCSSVPRPVTRKIRSLSLAVFGARLTMTALPRDATIRYSSSERVIHSNELQTAPQPTISVQPRHRDAHPPSTQHRPPPPFSKANLMDGQPPASRLGRP